MRDEVYDLETAAGWTRTWDLIGTEALCGIFFLGGGCVIQVPGDEWSGYPGDRDEEIPCRRMRSSSYVKAMGDEESAGESDTSPKSSPQKAVRPDALVLKSAIQRPHLDPQRYMCINFTAL